MHNGVILSKAKGLKEIPHNMGNSLTDDFQPSATWLKFTSPCHHPIMRYFLKELPPDYFDYLIAEFCGGGTMNVTPPPVRRSGQWC